MVKIVNELGTLVGKNFNEAMKIITSQVQTELENARDVANKVEQDYNDFKENVDQKISDQKYAYKVLKEAVNELNKVTKQFEKAVKTWQDEEIAKAAAMATVSLFSNIAGIFAGKAPDVDELFDALERIAKLIELILDIAKMMKTIIATFDVNVKYDKAGLEDIKFEATKDFTEALKQSSYFKEKSYQFDNLTSSANSYIEQLEEQTELKEATELKKTMVNTGSAGNQLVNEVCNL